MLEIFIQSLLIGYSGAIMPGSLLTYTLDKSIKTGAKAGLMISIGHALLELILVILILLGIGQYLGTAFAQLIIGILGGIVLLFFGISMVKDSFLGKVSIDFTNEANIKSGNLVIGSALVSAANPYFIVWWAAIGLGLIMNSYNTFGLIGVSLFYLGHILSDFTWYTFISLLVSKTRTFINLKVYKVIIAILGFSLIGFGTSFLISSVKIIAHYF